MIFHPSFLKIEIGDEIVFTPKDPGHTSKSIFTPKGAKPWDGETSKQTKVTFNKEGVYMYWCENHGIMGMTGVIQVGEATNLEEAKDFAKSYRSKFVMKKYRLETYLNEVK